MLAEVKDSCRTEASPCGLLAWSAIGQCPQQATGQGTEREICLPQEAMSTAQAVHLHACQGPGAGSILEGHRGALTS